MIEEGEMGKNDKADKWSEETKKPTRRVKNDGVKNDLKMNVPSTKTEKEVECSGIFGRSSGWSNKARG